MAKAIYSLKIFLFREEFKLTAREINGLRQVCIFLVKIYLKAWFTAPSAILAPHNDLIFMQDLIEYKTVNSSVSKAACSKMMNHLWYLSEQLAIISPFDDNVSRLVKQKMIQALEKNPISTDPKKKRFEIEQENLDTLLSADLSNFISKKSLTTFQIFDLPIDFMDKNVEFWTQDESYQENLAFFKRLSVVNDVAERGVALIEEYSKCLTKNEEQLQYLLQVVKNHRQKFPNCNKKNFV
ncbi:hypothetical protein RN001_011777 [Aquatica leii]|uniref:Uncharacterized protein n=1 Tax=Aquatica leii TaxID=1421715 RepID=A0AAN7SP83_9COLE|nr:hypothetical protein RN001_011777 [Aquatica leii]